MARGISAVLAAAVVALGGGSARVESAPPRAAKVPPPTLGLLQHGAQASLVRVDATLRPVAGRRLAVGPHLRGWSFSRDGSRLALGTDETARLLLVDVPRLRALGGVELVPAGSVLGTRWVAPRRLLAVVAEPTGATRIVTVDPVACRVLSRQRLERHVVRWVRTADGFALLLAPQDGIGPAQLAVVRPTGRVDTATLARVPAGTEQPEDPSGSLELREPGLAVVPAGRRAYVVPAGRELAEVDLDTLQVRYRTLSQRVSLLGRLRRWLEPDAQAKAITGPQRSALWLGGGLIAVAGSDHDGIRSTPAGLRLIDTRDWSVRTIDAGADQARLAGDLLLATGAEWNGGPAARAIGLRAYGLDGRRHFEALPAASVLVGHADAARAYVHVDGHGWQVVDLRSGRVLGRRASVPVVLAPAAADAG